MSGLRPLQYSGILLLFLLLTKTVISQVELSKYAPGIETGSLQSHYIEIFNSSRTQSYNLGGYIIITRYYSLRLPATTVIQPHQKLRIGTGNIESIDIDFIRLGNNFQQERVNSKEDGDFALLVSPDLQILDGFYFANQSDVNFLPDQRILDIRDRALAFKLPDESAPIWTKSFINNNGDPALAFICIDGEWQISSRNKSMVPAAIFTEVSANYTLEGIQIQWGTEIERESLKFLVERSRDGSRFQAIGSVEARGSIDQAGRYEYLDQTATVGQPYFYRIRHTDKFGEDLYSDFSQVRSSASENDLSMDYLLTGKELGVRFSSSSQQKVRLKLIDDSFREVDVLFYGFIKANVENLVKYHKPLLAGDYYVIAITESQRVYQKIQVRDN